MSVYQGRPEVIAARAGRRDWPDPEKSAL